MRSGWRMLLTALLSGVPFRRYPHALYFLDLLQTPEFRAKIANPAYKEMVHTQQVGWSLAVVDS